MTHARHTVPDILIYEDYVENTALSARALRAFFGAERVGVCDWADILAGCLTQDVRLLAILGGADLYFCEKLNGDGNKTIRAFVERGGGYLGICGGAYYAASTLSWRQGHETQEISGGRELGFFEGTAKGPLPEYGQESFLDQNDFSAMMALPLISDTGTRFLAAYQAGPAFEPCRPICEKTRILAYYDLPHRPIAALQSRIGAGQAVLIGPHTEISAHDIPRSAYDRRKSGEGNRRVSEILTATETRRATFFESILRSF